MVSLVSKMASWPHVIILLSDKMRISNVVRYCLAYNNVHVLFLYYQKLTNARHENQNVTLRQRVQTTSDHVTVCVMLDMKEMATSAKVLHFSIFFVPGVIKHYQYQLTTVLLSLELNHNSWFNHFINFFANFLDINECKIGTHNCHSQVTCTNTTGSFNCSCNKGFEGNGVVCNGYKFSLFYEILSNECISLRSLIDDLRHAYIQWICWICFLFFGPRGRDMSVPVRYLRFI